MNLGDRQSIGTSTLIIVFIVAVLLLVGGAFFYSITGSVLPLQASAESERVDQLFGILLGIGGFVFLLVEGVLLFSIIRFRARPDDVGDGPNVHGNTTLEIIWTLIPTVIVFFLVIESYAVWVDVRAEKDDEMVIQGVGQRFNWNFTYTDPLNRLQDATQQTFSASVLYTYAGRPVRLTLQTNDVNHAFWVPTMRIKQDFLAGRETEIRFTPTRAGRYRVVCAELCGGGHGQMFSYIEVFESEEDFMALFIDPQVETILNPPEDPVARGRLLLANNTYPCSGCHLLDDLGWTGNTGPVLNGIGNTAQRRPAPSPEYYIAQSIRHPNAYQVPGFGLNIMPQFGPTQQPPAVINGGGYNYMSDESLINIVSYLCTQTDSGESACGDSDAITEAVLAQSAAQ